MNDLILLFKSPKDLLSKEDIKLQRPIIYIYITIILLNSYINIYYIENQDLISLSKFFNISNIVLFLISVFTALFTLLICVNLTYFFISLFVTIFEESTFDKKQLKNLIYVSYMIPFILNYLINIFFGLIQKESLPLILMNINSIFIYMVVSLFIYTIIKYTIRTKKLHNILPILIFIINAAASFISIIRK